MSFKSWNFKCSHCNGIPVLLLKYWLSYNNSYKINQPESKFLWCNVKSIDIRATKTSHREFVNLGQESRPSRGKSGV